jgi:HAD superfamily hydrolase (TIGR01549 family)
MNQPNRKKLAGKRLILFDLDGVLLNSRENMCYAWKKAAATAGIEVNFEAYFREIGRPFQTILQRIGVADPDHVIESTFRVASMERMDLLSFYPYVKRVLSQLSSEGFKIGIVTSKDKMRTNAIIAMLAVDFDSVRSPNERLRGKPAPDHLLMAMAQANVDPSETLYIGDMDSDFEAAQRARLDYAHATWGYGDQPKENCWILSEISDLLISEENASD